MKTIDLCTPHAYSPLIPAVKAICEAADGEHLELVLNNVSAFNDLKEYLVEQHVGFREFYDGEQMRLQFVKKK